MGDCPQPAFPGYRYRHDRDAFVDWSFQDDPPRRRRHIAPLVEHSPLIWSHFKVFGPCIGSGIIGLTEWLAAILFIAGYVRLKAGIVGGLITTFMFTTTSSMLVTTPGTTISIPGIPFMGFMDLLGLFLYKDVIALGAWLYLISHFGKNALQFETKH